MLYHNVPLTSEKLRSVIDTAILQACGLAANTIVAGGGRVATRTNAVLGHCGAHEPIIIDIFPRSQKTGIFWGHHADGGARARQRGRAAAIRHTVLEGQKIGLRKLRAGVPYGRMCIGAVQDYFDAQGFKTGRRKGRMEGFFSMAPATGLGLEIHEAPRVGSTVARSAQTRPCGNSRSRGFIMCRVRAEVRIEDVALVTRNGARNLTRFEKVLEL